MGRIDSKQASICGMPANHEAEPPTWLANSVDVEAAAAPSPTVVAAAGDATLEEALEWNADDDE